MRAYVLLSTFYLSTSICIGQNPDPIRIQEIFVTDTSQIKSSSDFKIKIKSKAFYEDEKYVVSTTCRGEFGGSVIFKSKKTGIEYSCSSTCPVAVNRVDDKYYVTNSLMHMSGSTSVIEIVDPTKIYLLKKSSAIQKRYSIFDNPESFYKQGIKRLADTFKILITTSFTLNKKLYHFMRGAWGGEIYLSTIEKGHFKIIDSLSNGNLLYFSNEFSTIDGHYVIFFDSDPVNGYIDIFGNEIKIFRFDRLKGRKYDPVLAWQRTDLQKQRYHYLTDGLYNQSFDNAAFQKHVSFSSKYVKPELIYQALYNSDSSKFVAFYIEEDTMPKFGNLKQYQANNILIWGKKQDGKWYYSINSHGTHSVYYANSREAMQRYWFNRLQEENFFEKDSLKLNPAFWESSNFKYIRMQ